MRKKLQSYFFCFSLLYTGVERLTIYASDHDEMLGAADWLFPNERLGQVRISDISEAIRKRGAQIRRTDVITADVKAESHGHYYFYTSPAVSSDLILLLRDNHDPGQANGRPLINVDSELNFW